MNGAGSLPNGISPGAGNRSIGIVMELLVLCESFGGGAVSGSV